MFFTNSALYSVGMATIFPGLHTIKLPIPFELGEVNAYLIERDPLTLVDCGVSTDDAYQVLVDELAVLGYRVADIQQLVITHHHVDHRGLASRIVAESGADVYTHPYSALWLERPDESRDRLDRFTHDIFREGGVPEPVIATMNRVGEYMDMLSGEKLDATVKIGEGDRIEMGGRCWQTYHTPGHAGGMLCFYQPESRVMLVSDHLLRDVSSNPLIEMPADPGGERPKRLLDYLREMQRIAALDIAIAYPGHGDTVTDVPGLVESRLVFHEKRAEKLYGLFGGQPRCLYELTQMMFPTVPETHQYLTLSEVLGHLDVLEREDRVAPELRNGLLYWHPI